MGKQVAAVSWQAYPDMDRNPQFEDAVRAAAPSSDTPIYFICRSGVRSRAAAVAMTAAGFGRCHTVAGGFAGGPASARLSGRPSGWQARGLPSVTQRSDEAR